MLFEINSMSQWQPKPSSFTQFHTNRHKSTQIHTSPANDSSFKSKKQPKTTRKKWQHNTTQQLLHYLNNNSTKIRDRADFSENFIFSFFGDLAP
jgi:site-specific recombinase XerC